MKSAIKYFFVLVFLTEFLAGQDSTKTKHWVIEPFGGMGQIPILKEWRTDGYGYNFRKSKNPEFPFTTTQLSYVTHLGGNFSYRIQSEDKYGNRNFVDFGIGVQWFNYRVNYQQPNVSTGGHFSTIYYYEKNEFEYYINRLNLGVIISNGTITNEGFYFGHSIGLSFQTHIFKKDISNPVTVVPSGPPWPGSSYPSYTKDEKIKNYTKNDISVNDNIQIGFKFKNTMPYIYGQINAYNLETSFLPINILFSWGIGCKILLK